MAALITVWVEVPAWSAIAALTQWSAARTIEHISDALLFYASQIARRAQHRLPVLRDGRSAPASEQLDKALTAAHVVEGLLRELGPGRAWHPSGLADAGGWVGMAVTEILVRGHDAGTALGVDYRCRVRCGRGPAVVVAVRATVGMGRASPPPDQPTRLALTRRQPPPNRRP